MNLTRSSCPAVRVRNLIYTIRRQRIVVCVPPTSAKRLLARSMPSSAQRWIIYRQTTWALADRRHLDDVMSRGVWRHTRLLSWCVGANLLLKALRNMSPQGCWLWRRPMRCRRLKHLVDVCSYSFSTDRPTASVAEMTSLAFTIVSLQDAIGRLLSDVKQKTLAKMSQNILASWMHAEDRTCNVHCVGWYICRVKLFCQINVMLLYL